ncbi:MULTISPECIES: alpha-L-rhamnosidase C-terminal domain-containing protein [unclassified Nonomuraea]
MGVAEGVLRWFLPFRGGDGLRRFRDLLGRQAVRRQPGERRGERAHRRRGRLRRDRARRAAAADQGVPAGPGGALLGAADHVAGLCKDWAALGQGTFRECWDGGSYCHGWSATPSRDLLVHTLGITPAEPGYERVRIAPRLGHLRWARGAVPSPHGLIAVEVRDDTITVDSPVPYEIVHPDGRVSRGQGSGTTDLHVLVE